MMIRRLWLLLLTALLAITPAHARKRIALTFDDIPREQGAFLSPDERTARLIAALKRARVAQAAFFVTVGNLHVPDGAGGEKRIAAYAAAGHIVANHSFAHRSLSETPAADYLADIDRAEGWLRALAGHRPWFRYPYIDEGGPDKPRRDAVRAGLAARGLRNAYVTVDGWDWNMDALTIAAKRAGKPMNMAALRDLYVETMVGAAEHADDLARRTLGRSPAHVIMLHETDLAALFVADLVAGLRRAGWEIVTADEAYRDPLANLTPDPPSAQGTIIGALAWKRGAPEPQGYDRAKAGLADRLFAERVLGDKPAP